MTLANSFMIIKTIMKLFIEIENGSSFEMEVDNHDTLLKIKQNIEKSQQIPVSQQRVIFDGISIVREDLNLEQCQIVNESLLQINVSPNHSPIHNNEFHQTEEGLGSSMCAEEYFEMQDWPLTSEELNKIYSYRSETRQMPSTSNIQPEKKIQVFVLPYSNDRNMALNIYVNTMDQVKILRNLLVESQRKGHIKLPQEGYVFELKGRVMNEDQSFEWHNVCHNDTIQIFPATLPKFGSINCRS